MWKCVLQAREGTIKVVVSQQNVSFSPKKIMLTTLPYAFLILNIETQSHLVKKLMFDFSLPDVGLFDTVDLYNKCL